MIVLVVTQVCNYRKVHFYIHFVICKLYLKNLCFKNLAKNKKNLAKIGAFIEHKHIFIITAKIDKRNIVSFSKWARRQSGQS